MQTLAALLSCLKPGKGLVCFASNKELQRRLAGVSDKTIRRHIAEMSAASVLRRQDSPNGKRYSSRDPLTGEVEAYGIDLTPMLENSARWSDVAEAVEQQKRHLRHLRTKILARLSWFDQSVAGRTDTDGIRKQLRRASLTPNQALEILAGLDATMPTVTAVSEIAAVDPADHPVGGDMSASAGQNDRDQSRSYTEDLEKKENQASDTDHDSEDVVMLVKLQNGCESALQFATVPLRTWIDVERYATTLAPMVGIDKNLYQTARARLGNKDCALAVIAMVQLEPGIRNVQAYFRSLVTGRRAATFNARQLISKLDQLRSSPR